ncbi:MAG: zinc ribbon domain-containing protein [Phycisphaerae bacterium]
MPYDPTDDEYEEDGYDPEEPDGADLDDDDETVTVPCPHCGEEIPETADRCPYCGDWVVQGGEHGAVSRGPAYVVLLVACILLIVALLLLWR